MQFIDLVAQQNRIRGRLDKRINNVLTHGMYILGPEVSEFEEKLGEFCGAKHCVTCANGTDALEIVLMALGIGEGDAVFVPAFTFAASAEVVPRQGAVPVLVDVEEDSFNISLESLTRAYEHSKTLGLNPTSIIAVDLFGLPADHPNLEKFAARHNLVLIDDAAQGFGAQIGNRKIGTFGSITTTSFFPAKPLGCYGDGGAILTDRDDLADLAKSLRAHGKGTAKYDNVRIGTNSRLDTLQAGILLEKLAIYADELRARQLVAERYEQALAKVVRTPKVTDQYYSVWAQYTLQMENGSQRDALQSHLSANNIPSMIYYPKPLHKQGAFAEFPIDPEGLSMSSRLSKTALSLPMHPYLSESDQDSVISAITDFFSKS